MGESRGPAEGRYQLPEGTYRELIVKDRMTKFLKELKAARAARRSATATCPRTRPKRRGYNMLTSRRG